MNQKTPLWTKPTVWVSLGVGLGIFATGSFLSGTGFRTVLAQAPHTTVVRHDPAGSGMAALEQMNEAFADVSEAVAPSIVHIKVGGSQPNLMDGSSQPQGQGSGFIYRSDGWIVTNDHVVEGAKEVTVVFNDGRELKGTVRASGDARNDIALVKVNASDLPAAHLADSGLVRVGHFSLAFGAPFGLENTVTVGHISALGRTSTAGGGMSGQLRSYAGMIQTDAPINPGNSGGPLVNIHGEVIGVNTSIYGTGSGFGEQGNVGIGFAIPSNQVRLIAERLITNGKLERAFLGVMPADLTPYEKQQRHLDVGAICRQVQENTPAARAGLKTGDVILDIAGTPIRGHQDLLNAMLDLKPGTKVKVKYSRDGKEAETTADLTTLPKEDSAPPRTDSARPRFQWPFQDNGGDDELDQLFPKTRKNEVAPQNKSGRATIGVSIKSVDANDRKNFNIPANKEGALITSVTNNSIASKFGLKPGDIITHLNDQTIRSAEDVTRAMQGKKPGDKGSITVENFEDGNVTQSYEFTF